MDLQLKDCLFNCCWRKNRRYICHSLQNLALCQFCLVDLLLHLLHILIVLLLFRDPLRVVPQKAVVCALRFEVGVAHS